MVLAKPKSILPHTKFKAEVYVLTKEEGGRHTPFFNGYRPQFYFRTTDVTGIVQLNEGLEMVMPGDNVSFAGELIAPIAMEQGVRFAVREARWSENCRIRIIGKEHKHRFFVHPDRRSRKRLKRFYCHNMQAQF